ncbi:MAG: hypothetical protein U5P41_04855 [Gammaproteobacteria bacterium]|nr:hypothetical protein [Gammaproteobacteria bacterium]
MPEEATLDAFVRDDAQTEATGDVETEQTDDAETDGDSTATSGESVETGTDTTGADDRIVEPTAVTSSWLGDDVPCSSCGEPGGSAWQDGDQRVCTACKPWTRTGDGPCDQ